MCPIVQAIVDLMGEVGVCQLWHLKEAEPDSAENPLNSSISRGDCRSAKSLIDQYRLTHQCSWRQT